ncbi:hypothetical protein [Flavobacterium yafengii]|uniref:hypothetical protein n=1 Tax=Flavobacterium yafengii TaxID=3041253 RepID=UPI0024A7B3AB|nr:hypothetical protein [Flavobacterium yafengii]MDI6045195.1 hypothetical protein [Flavobacterium yafengii]
MRKNYFSKKVLQACVLFFMIITANVFAQVGIGTITPHASSVLDVSSTTQGMLTPRMTTAQRMAISSPADGLMVYDTDLKSFYHYNSTLASWNVINSGTTGRLKFKRIKSTDVLATVLAAEKTAGGNTKYLLDTGTLYEINGSVMVDLPIELNNAYVIGLDSGEDKLIKATGDLFVGTTGGSIRVLTLVASGNVFNITGNGTPSLILRDCIVANSANVGLLKGFSLVFVSIVQYVGNANGIIYENIDKLLINNAGWFGGSAPLSNAGTYEKIVGTFGQVTKQGGFSEVSGSSIGLDVSLNPTITGDAVLETVVFSGSNVVGYVKPYTTGAYTGYNFNGFWTVRSTGIANEGDSFATGNLYLDRTTSSPTATFPTANAAYKVPGTTVSTNLYRMSTPVNNRIVYLGKKTRTVSVTTSISFEAAGSGVTDYLFFFVKYTASGVASIVTSSETYIDSNSGFMQSFPVTGTIQVNSGDYIELHAARLTGTDKTLTFRSYNMSIK